MSGGGVVMVACRSGESAVGSDHGTKTTTRKGLRLGEGVGKGQGGVRRARRIGWGVGGGGMHPVGLEKERA